MAPTRDAGGDRQQGGKRAPQDEQSPTRRWRSRATRANSAPKNCRSGRSHNRRIIGANPATSPPSFAAGRIPTPDGEPDARVRYRRAGDRGARMTRTGSIELDRVVRGGTVIDGTGAPGRPADVGHPRRPDRRDRGAARARAAPRWSRPTATSSAPASSTCTPTTTSRSSGTPRSRRRRYHGVTTVIGGNCGFSVAPLEPAESDYLMRMLARVEGMPLGDAGRPPPTGTGPRSARTSPASTARSPRTPGSSSATRRCGAR